ncbi:recombinase family protein [Nocardia fluminea]|uniref:recombinase family protein n=1 Tax=Nocardia fluminea TaxID=134984 RepID=UPI00365D26C6
MYGSIPSDTATQDAGRADLAILYLRVSTKGQMDTAVDIDPDGNSIATQRELGLRKAENLGAHVVRDFVEPHSAKNIDDRKVFRETLAYLHSHPEIKYLIVYMRSRAFRNRFDAAIVEVQLKKIGVRIVSVKEDFGEGPHAVAMEGMLDIMNDLQNTLQGLDVATKMRHKAINGGTIGLAKIGYLNVRADFEGRQINTVALDPERAPLILKAWELYATGEYTIERLEATMADLGLTTRPTRRSAAGTPISSSKLHAMLSDPYYVGFVVYKGELYPGRHEPIVSHKLFDTVQDVLNARSAKGQRDRIHMHYLKGGLFCDRCHQQGRTSRLIFSQIKGRSGQFYTYFFCVARQEGLCNLPHLRTELVEQAVIDHYITLQLPPNFISEVRHLLETTLADEQAGTREHHAALNRQLKLIDQKESRLVDLAADGSMPQAKIRAKLNRLKQDRARVEAGLVNTGEELSIGVTVLRDALHLMDDPQRLYLTATDSVRRHLNQAFYQRFYIDDLEVATDQKTPIATELQEAAHAYHGKTISTAEDDAHPQNVKSPRIAEALSISTGVDPLPVTGVQPVTGLSEATLVGLTGFEPATT